MKKGYKSHSNFMKKNYSTIVADINSILSVWEQFKSNLLKAIRLVALKKIKYALQSQTSQRIAFRKKNLL